MDEKCHICGISLSREDFRLYFKGNPALPTCEKCSDQMNKRELPKPKKIKDYLDKYVIGQENAKKVISVAIYNHYKRVFNKKDTENEVEIEKSNLLFIGPTGSGKTFLIETMARFIDVPFALADATTLTEAGYVGEDVENILARLLLAANGDLIKAESGIIYIDEMDKITRKSENPSITRDVGGEGVQQALLKIIEGTVANVPINSLRKHPHQPYTPMNTKNILFILGGTFDGIEKVIASRLNKKVIGFKNESENILNYDEIINNIESDDLIKFGIIPELVGRIPVRVGFRELTEEDLVNILIKPQNAIVEQYKKLFKYDDIKLEFSQEALLEIARCAKNKKMGARGLRSIIEKTLLDPMFETPSDPSIGKIIISEDVITKGLPPTIIKKKGS